MPLEWCGVDGVANVTEATEYLDAEGEEDEQRDGGADGVLAAEDEEEHALPDQAQELNPKPPPET